MGDFTDPIKIPMLTDATLLATTSHTVPGNNCRQHWHFIKIKAGTTAGVVVIEEAAERDFAGTWNQIDSLDIAARIAEADGVFAAALAAGDVEVPIPGTFPGPFGHIRHRVATAITGGATHTVTSWMRRVLIGN